MLVEKKGIGKRVGNPNMKYLDGTGAKTETGKMMVEVGTRAIKKSNGWTDASRVKKLMKEAGVDFSVMEKAIEQRNLFEIWLRGFNTKELNEIERIDSLIQILETDVSNRVMEKLTMGVPLEEEDMKLIRLLKDTLVDSHKMKFGERHVNISADYKDIREMMFD